ncbi:MAG: hypothetical protein KatS3mg077_3254 [Candidatus Binatia bacterium]|nr:MAG: hypothetical protein KatS3mg077_3254 [Candidatus Binatia bacterium]
MKSKTAWMVLALVGAFSVSGVSPGWAHGRDDRGGKPPKMGGHDDHDHHGGGWMPGNSCTVRPVIDPVCKAQCDSAERSCKAQARTALQSCLGANCADALAAAQSACAGGRTQECMDAWQAYIQCAQPCTSAYRAALADCRAAEDACKAGCPTIVPTPCVGPTPVDPVCKAQCRLTSAQCQAAAQQTSVTCVQGCSDEIAAARQVCSSNPSSADCQAALAAVRACLTPCSTQLRSDLLACKTAEQTCRAGCGGTVNP